MRKFSAFINEQEEALVKTGEQGLTTTQKGQTAVAKTEEKKCPDYTPALVNIIKNIQFSIKELNRRNEMFSNENTVAKTEPQKTQGEQKGEPQKSQVQQPKQLTGEQKPTQKVTGRISQDSQDEDSQGAQIKQQRAQSGNKGNSNESIKRFDQF